MTETAWKNRIVGSADVAPSELVAHPLNWRMHSKAQRSALAGALDTVGWVQQVLVNQRTGRMVDGHARVEEAIARDEPTVPVLYVDLDDDEERLVLATLDPIGAMADRDGTKLRALLEGVAIDDDRLIAFLAKARGSTGTTEPDDVGPLPPTSWVSPGEVYQLGNHRIVCGDATKPDDVARLGGELVDLVVTDPPYGVAYQRVLGTDPGADATPEDWRAHRAKQASVARRLHRRSDLNLSVQNDDLTPEQTRALVASAMAAAPLRAGGSFYLFAPPGDAELAFRLGLIDAGLPLRHSLVWVKDRFAFGRSDYHYRHESILYGWREGASHYFVPDRTKDTVIELAQPKRSPEHPTMKPVDLVVGLVENSSRPGDLVYDPFLGSGTAIIAAEMTGRRARALELEPRYVQVAIERWQAFTGREAVRG